MIDTPKLTTRTIPAVERQLIIPKHLPPTVRAVAESLLVRDPESAKRYLEAHISQKSRMKKDDSSFDLIEDN